MFGQFTFADFEANSPILGPIYLIVYLFFIGIVVLNILIAILAYIFEKAAREA